MVTIYRDPVFLALEEGLVQLWSMLDVGEQATIEVREQGPDPDEDVFAGVQVLEHVPFENGSGAQADEGFAGVLVSSNQEEFFWHSEGFADNHF